MHSILPVFQHNLSSYDKVIHDDEDDPPSCVIYVFYTYKSIVESHNSDTISEAFEMFALIQGSTVLMCCQPGAGEGPGFNRDFLDGARTTE